MGVAKGVLITLFSMVIAWVSVASYHVIEVCCCVANVSVVVGPGPGCCLWLQGSFLIRLTHVKFVYGGNVVVGVFLSLIISSDVNI